MRLSYLLRSHDKADALAKTLLALPTVTPLPPMLWEVRVLVGASLDEVGGMLSERFPRAHGIVQHGSDEATAIKLGLSECAGEHVIVLDPESHPMDHRSISTALARLDRDPSLGAVSGRFSSSGNSTDEPLLPTWMVGGATCFRRSILSEMGEFAADFTGTGASIDLSFRLWNAGHRIERCTDMVFQQNRPQPATPNENIANFRDELLLAHRYFPPKIASAYWDDWKLRYTALARYEGRRKEVWKALWAARKSRYQAKYRRRTPLSDDAVEGMLGLQNQATTIGNWARQNNIWRVVIADFTGNLFATHHACKSVGLQIRCVADNNPAFEDVEYRGLPIVPINSVFDGGGIEGVIISNPYPWQAQQLAHVFRRHFKGPILQITGATEPAQIRRASAA